MPTKVVVSVLGGDAKVGAAKIGTPEVGTPVPRMHDSESMTP
jgi:hypothetical protein